MVDNENAKLSISFF